MPRKENDNIYCGCDEVPKGKVLGTPEQCNERQQLRYYGVKALSKADLKKLRAKKTGVNELKLFMKNFGKALNDYNKMDDKIRELKNAIEVSKSGEKLKENGFIDTKGKYKGLTPKERRRAYEDEIYDLKPKFKIITDLKDAMKDTYKRFQKLLETQTDDETDEDVFDRLDKKIIERKEIVKNNKDSDKRTKLLKTLKALRDEYGDDSTFSNMSIDGIKKEIKFMKNLIKTGSGRFFY